MEDGQLSFPERLELKDMTAAELFALTPEECFKLLPEYTVEELKALRRMYFEEWLKLSADLVDWRITNRALRDEARARLAEVHRLWSRLDDLEWWKESGATLEHIKEQFKEWERIAEHERQYQEMWHERDKAKGEAWMKFHRDFLKREAENL